MSKYLFDFCGSLISTLVPLSKVASTTSNGLFSWSSSFSSLSGSSDVIGIGSLITVIPNLSNDSPLLDEMSCVVFSASRYSKYLSPFLYKEPVLFISL